MTFGTVLTISGVALAVTLIESVLEAMEKPFYAQLLRMLAIGAFVFFALEMFSKLLAEMAVFIDQWN